MNNTELNYYVILDIPRTATKEEVTFAYRRLAVRLNPNRDPKHDRDFVPMERPDDPTHLCPLPRQKQWDYINMAYDVLGDDLNREIYDRFGEAGLFQGMVLPNGYFPPYQYHGDNMKVYHDVFDSYSPYANLIDVVTNPPVLYSTKEHGIGVRTRDPPVEKVIQLELDDVRCGCCKLMHVMRQEYVNCEQTRTEIRTATLKINIAPGTTAGTRYCFREAGDRCPTKIPADIIFITADKPHPIFERRNHHDLVYKRKIDLCQALVGFRFTLETMDKRKLNISITDVVHPNYVKVIPKEGLPKCRVSDIAIEGSQSVVDSKDVGDLIVEFEVQFPNYLNQEMKLRCRSFFAVLRSSEEEEAGDTSPVADYIQRLNL